MISSHFTYAGNVLNDKQLEEFSLSDIKAIRHSEDIEIIGTSLIPSTQKHSFNSDLEKQRIPFQLIFLKSVKSIKRTTVQIVSYVNNKEIIFLRSPELK